jgi:hypothetical protein
MDTEYLFQIHSGYLSSFRISRPDLKRRAVSAIPTVLLLSTVLVGAIIIVNTSVFGNDATDASTTASRVTESMTPGNSTPTTPFLTVAFGQQTSDKISTEAYDYSAIAGGVSVTVRNVGSITVLIDSIFFDGQVASVDGTGTPSGCINGTATAPTTACTFVISGGAASAALGTSHTIKVLDSMGATLVFSVVAGETS